MIKNRIRELRDRLGMSLDDLAKCAGTSNQQISNLELGKRKLAPEWMERLARCLGVLPHEIIYDPGDTVVAGMMPIMGEVRAGAWLEIDALDEPVGTIPVAKDTRFRGLRQFALRVVGTSMNKVAMPGTYVIVVDWAEHGGELQDGELIVVRRERAQTYEATLKRARKGKDTWELWPESDDPKHQDPIMWEDGDRDVEVTIMGKVIGKYEPL